MLSKITAMDFGVLSPELIKNLARVRIVTSDLYDVDGYPVEGGVMDPRLGVIDPGLYCRTCSSSMGDCPGHFGYLELAKPDVHVLYTKVIYQILKFVCKKCGRIMSEENILEKTNPPAKCPHCKSGRQRKMKFAKPYTFYDDKKELTPVDIREIFEKIPDKDLKNVGINGGRPEWLILTLFPIPPVTMRPSITLESGERSEDDLTHKMVDIVRINQSLKENIDIGAPEFIINDLWELVQYHVATYFDNELTGAPLARHRSGRPLKGVIQRLKAKEGRIRGNLLGKRVNFSSRTVISPDPKLSINEVGIPEKVAKELTIPIHVTKFTEKHVKNLLKNDKINYVIRPDGRRIKVTETNKKDLIENIQPEWIVDRQLENDDIVLLNRQPSLHRISIMAHRVRIMPNQTFRINPSVCFPYNADFDGDEMNIHVLQTEEARAEAKFLMQVENNLISPKFGGPVIGLDLDQVSGIYLLTHNHVSMTREDASHLLGMAGIDIQLPDKKQFSGKDIFSLILPNELNAEYECRWSRGLDLSYEKKKELDGVVVIKNGKVEKGRIDKDSVGAESGKLLNKILKVSGKDVAKNFIDNAGKLGSAYLMIRGFSIGISDLDLSIPIKKKIIEELENSKKNANKLINQYNNKMLKILPGLTPEDSLEAQILNTLSMGISRVSDIVSDNISESDIISMAMGGSKGSMVNITQMAAAVGQETILGKRITRGYVDRTLPHFTTGDLSPQAHGFVMNGFKQGLRPFELFWNIMNGREGLMDKSLRTRKSGYMQRRLINALQDLKVCYDLTVRNSVNSVIQFKAGEDGIDPTKSDWGKLRWSA